MKRSHSFCDSCQLKEIISKKSKPEEGSFTCGGASEETTSTSQAKLFPLPCAQPGKSKVQSFIKPSHGLNVDYYSTYFNAHQAKTHFIELERSLKVYLESSQNEVRVFGKLHKVPRKQAAFGDPGLSYEFSGVRIPANPWIPVLIVLRDQLSRTLGESFNFVLVNRYKNGSDHMGEHRDDETDLVAQAPIAALSFGQRRDFIFRHKDARGSKAPRKDIASLKIVLEHGSLLVMKHPTNVFWYHSLPARKMAPGPRISLTYRVLKTTSQKGV